MFIVNGRVGNNKNIGRFTCRNASIVDYCITSPELLKLFFDFDILESSKLFSKTKNLYSQINHTLQWYREVTYKNTTQHIHDK